MNIRLIGKIISFILLLEIAFMFPGILFELFDHNMAGVRAFLITYVIILAAAGILNSLGRRAPRGFYAREGLMTTGLSWIAMSFFGCLPFWFSKEIPNFVDALFEMVSGFTTTGSSVVTDVEAMSRGMLYWRSFSHWVGGMGVLVFLMAVVPLSKGNEGYSLHILRAESPGPSVGKLVPKMKKTASILYTIYICLTALDFVCLLAAGMPWFDAMCITFGTAGTGGFGVRNSSMAAYSPAAQTVTTVFMFLFGTNFSIYYLILLKHYREAFKDEELRFYLFVIVASITAITVNISSYYGSLREALHHAAFQVATIMSTSGFATADFDQWPVFSKTILLILMVGGACAGSTGGGMKMSRLLLAIKGLRRNLHENLHPREVSRVRMNNAPVDEQVMRNLNGYIIAYMGIVMGSILIVSLDGFSVETNLSAVLATFNNIGPGLDQVGPTCNFSGYSVLSKLIFIFDMLAGRLEIFPILILFSRSAWRRA
jgi:trk system potassium uptake protein TrkH